MNIINSFMKKIGFCMIHLMGLIESFLLSMFFSGSVLAFVFAILGIFWKTPFAKIYFLGCIPFALVYFIMLEVKLHKTVKMAKQSEKEALESAKKHAERMKQKEETINSTLKEETEE